MKSLENIFFTVGVRPKKVAIVGRPGAGKTTFALEISKLLNIPVYHLDRYFFIKNWQERPTEEFLALQREIISKPQWIIDGNALNSLELRYSAADVVFHLALPKEKCLWRVFFRFVRRRLRKSPIEDRAEGCGEILHWKFIRYLWHFDSHIAPELIRLKKAYPQVPIYTIEFNVFNGSR